MSTAADLFTVVKKLFLVSEEMSRLSSDVKELSHRVNEHGERLARIETLLSVAAKQSRIILPGN